MSDLSADIARLAISSIAAAAPEHGLISSSEVEKAFPPPVSPASSNDPLAYIHSRLQGLPPHLRPLNPPSFLTTTLLKIFARTIGSLRIPLQVNLAADALSRHIPSSAEGKWRIEVRNHVNTWPRIGERRTVRLIVWRRAKEGEVPLWEGEMLVHLFVPGGRLESVTWRFGPGLADSEGCIVGSAKNEWDDWRMLHLVRYYAIQVEDAGVKVGGGTEELARIQLEVGKSMILDSVVSLVFRAVKKALGKPYEPDRQQLEALMGRISERLGREGTDVGRLVVTRGFRASGSKGAYIPAAFVEIHRRRPEGSEIGNAASGVLAATGKAAAVILIDVWRNSNVKLMGVMYADEEPVAHFYRTRFPPPDTANIEKDAAAKPDAREGDGSSQSVDDQRE